MKHITFSLIVILSLFAAGSQLPMSMRNPAVMFLTDGPYTWHGTAFQLRTSKGPVIITNKHVCDKESNMFVTRPGKQNRTLLVVKAVSDIYDLCLLSGIHDLPELSLATGYLFGEYVTVDGFPFDKRIITTGHIGPAYLAPDRLEKSVTVEFSGLVNLGNSGSPVLNTSGQVVGVICTKLGQGNGGGFVPLEHLVDFLEENGY